jgi:hypothetical protein
VGEVFVGGHHLGRRQTGGRDRGAQHVDAIQGGLGVDLGLCAGEGEGLLVFRTANPLGFLFGREGVSVEESSVVYS